MLELPCNHTLVLQVYFMLIAFGFGGKFLMEVKPGFLFVDGSRIPGFSFPLLVLGCLESYWNGKKALKFVLKT